MQTSGLRSTRPGLSGAPGLDGRWATSIGVAEGGREGKPSGRGTVGAQESVSASVGCEIGSSRRVCFLQKCTDTRKLQHTWPSTGRQALPRRAGGRLFCNLSATSRQSSDSSRGNRVPTSNPPRRTRSSSSPMSTAIHPIIKRTTCEDPKSRSLQGWDLE
ncbi:hypothetical protein FA13DRAFT_1178015 [Coprinellus micaceus]|uniref:Uncharacterized protein n=1 Tax=Coprinellus micaceus TaxID=71717 RepID=A0A4Y7STV9_COPMI|nr:hypothetical protein FA13DRAFT_1178015 [Coprinellus micaceus]